jgi:alkylation response protein AidB-like acyl-CoA dehydrogenase
LARKKNGMHDSDDRCKLQIRVPEENRLGKEGEGWTIAMETMRSSRPAVGALAVGIAQGALDFAIHYANERIQFGKPIASFQAIQFMIADMPPSEAARALVYQAAAGSMPILRIGGLSRRQDASDAAMKVTTDAVQSPRGYGYEGLSRGRMMRDTGNTTL